VVESGSAKIGDGREETGSIPADHSNMTKFAMSSDVGFRRVSAQLRRWVEDIRSRESMSRNSAPAALQVSVVCVPPANPEQQTYPPKFKMVCPALLRNEKAALMPFFRLYDKFE